MQSRFKLRQMHHDDTKARRRTAISKTRTVPVIENWNRPDFVSALGSQLKRIKNPLPLQVGVCCFVGSTLRGWLKVLVRSPWARELRSDIRR